MSASEPDLGRVLFYGNQGNAGFRLASWLRETGIDARLLLHRDVRSQRSRPEWQDPALREGYPPWIERYRRLKYVHWLVPPRKARAMAREATVVVTTGRVVVGALALDGPVVFFPMGGEFTRFPFQKDLLHRPVAALYRRRLRRVRRILSAQENVHETARRLDVGDRSVRFPLPVEVREIHELVNRDLLARLEERYADRRAVFLLLSRKTMDPEREEYKAPERFARALKRFLREGDADGIQVVVGLHGPDAERFRTLVEELDVASACDFVGHLPRPDLHAYFSLSRAVVFDQFGGITRHNLSGSVREALSLGATVVTATEVDADPFREAYGPGCPLLFAETTEQISRRMHQVAGWSGRQFEERASESRAWSERHLDWRARIPEFVEILREAAEEETGADTS